MKQIQVRFCMGCGQVSDGIEPVHGDSQWMNAHRYLVQKGCHWQDLERTDEACPSCARVFAYARRGELPDLEEGRSYTSR